jgi:hypothetical protein
MRGSTVDVCGWAQHLPWLNKAPAVPVSRTLLVGQT